MSSLSAWATTTEVINYTYGTAEQVIKSTFASGASTSYQYDSMGNRLFMNTTTAGGQTNNPPNTPTLVSPTDGAVVSAGSMPTLNWQGSDPDAGDMLTLKK